MSGPPRTVDGRTVGRSGHAMYRHPERSEGPSPFRDRLRSETAGKVPRCARDDEGSPSMPGLFNHRPSDRLTVRPSDWRAAAPGISLAIRLTQYVEMPSQLLLAPTAVFQIPPPYDRYEAVPDLSALTPQDLPDAAMLAIGFDPPRHALADAAALVPQLRTRLSRGAGGAARGAGRRCRRSGAGTERRRAARAGGAGRGRAAPGPAPAELHQRDGSAGRDRAVAAGPAAGPCPRQWDR